MISRVSCSVVLSNRVSGVKILRFESFIQLQAILGISHSVRLGHFDPREVVWSLHLWSWISERKLTQCKTNAKDVPMWCKKGIFCQCNLRTSQFWVLNILSIQKSYYVVCCRCSLIEVSLWILKTRQSKEQIVLTCGRWIMTWTSFV